MPASRPLHSVAVVSGRRRASNTLHIAPASLMSVYPSLCPSVPRSVRLSVCLSYSNISLPRRPKHSAAVARNVWSAVSHGQSIFTHPPAYRTEARWMFSAAFVCLISVCLFVCRHDNCRTTKRRTIKTWRLGTLSKNLARIRRSRSKVKGQGH